MYQVTPKFIQTIKSILNSKIQNNYQYNKPIILWNNQIFYENISEDEQLVHKVTNIIKQKEFQEFIAKPIYNLKIGYKDFTIYILPLINIHNDESVYLKDILEQIKIMYLSKSCSESTVCLLINGGLFLKPDRKYAINIMNNTDYTVNVFKLDEDGKINKTIIHYYGLLD